MKSNKTHAVAAAAALTASLIFGLSFMFSRLALDVAAPTVLLAFRFTAAVLFMSLVVGVNALVRRLRGKPLFPFSLRGKPLKQLLLLGLVQPVAYFIFENYGILYTSSAVAGTIIAMVPVMCILVDLLILHRAVTKRQIVCAVVAVGGVALVSLGGEVVISAIGLLFLILTLLSDTCYLTLSQKASQHCNAFETTYMMFVVGMAVFVPLAAIQCAGNWETMLLPAVTSGKFWVAVLYLGVCSSGLAFMLVNFSTGHLTITETALFANITTVVSVLAGVLLLKEPFGVYQMLGVAVILVCVYVANMGGKTEESE